MDPHWLNSTTRLKHTKQVQVFVVCIPEIFDIENQKSIKSKFFWIFQSSWNAHKPNFMLIPWATTKLFGQKKAKFIVWSRVSSSITFLFIDILLMLQQQIFLGFCNFSCNSEILMDLLQFLTQYHRFAYYWTITY